ncbi:MAG: photosynthetic reaction center cytochrome c subunit family protein [Acidobacteriota bacterium]
MKFWSRPAMFVVPRIAVASLICLSLAHSRAVAQERPKLSEEAFKNIQALKGIPVDDFLGTMGIMSASLGYDCAECHVGAGTNTVDWAADTPRKVMARRMVNMVTAINRANFQGRQVVTCWTCHRNSDKPQVTPTMAIVYGTPSFEPDDIIVQTPGLPSAESILDKYIQAAGGAQRLAGLTSFVGTGTSVGFGGFGGGGQVTVIAKAPDKRAIIIIFKDETGRGDQIRSYNGSVGWLRTPLNVLGEYQLSGGDLDGARVDALLSFPGKIKQALTNWRVGPPTTITDLPAPSSQSAEQPGGASEQTHDVNVVQGTGPRGLVVTLYFDKNSGLLLRELRYGKSPIGRVPTQIDFADYRDVGGIKIPYRMTFAWLDGRDSISLNDVKINVAVDEAKFGKPAPLK